MMKNYYSIEELSTRTNDMLNVYLIPMINIFNMICYLLATIVLSNNRHFKGEINRLLYLFCLVGFLTFAMGTCVAFIRCGSLCPFGYDYISKLIEMYVFLYLGRSAEMFSIFCQLNIMFIKLKAFSLININQQNKKFHKNWIFFIKIKAYIVISFCFSILPIIYGRKITQIGYLVTSNNKTLNQTIIIIRSLYILERIDDENSFFNQFIQIFSASILLLIYLIMIILNTIIMIKLKSFIKRKSTIISSKF